MSKKSTPRVYFSAGYSEIFEGNLPLSPVATVPIEYSDDVYIYDPRTARCFHHASRGVLCTDIREVNFCLMLADWVNDVSATSRKAALSVVINEPQTTFSILRKDIPNNVLFGVGQLSKHFATINRLNDAIGVFVETEYQALIKSSSRRTDVFGTLVEQRGYVTALIMEIYAMVTTWFNAQACSRIPTETN